MRPRWRKVVADLWENKTRTLLVVLSIAIGIFAVGTIVAASVIIPRSMNNSYAASHPANIVLRTDAFDEDLLKSVRNMDGIADVEGQRAVTVRLRIGPDQWTRLELTARSDMHKTAVNVLWPVAGNLVPADRQVLILIQTSEKYGLQPGDRLEIELSDGTSRELIVAGIVRDLTSGQKSILSDGMGFVTDETLEWLRQPQSYNALLAVVAQNPSDPAHIQSMADKVTKRVEGSGREVYNTQLYQRNKHPLGSIVVAILGVMAMLGVLLVFLSGALIANTLSALLTQHLRQIGVMKLVGARRAQVVSMYVALVLTLGGLALLLAVPPAGALAYALSAMVGDKIGFIVTEVPDLPFVPQALLVQVVMALTIPLLASALPIFRGSGTTVHQAITSTGISAEPIQKGRLDRLMARMRWVSRPLLISVRNTFRRKGRLVLTLFTLTLGGAIFISVFNVRVSLNQTVEGSTRYFGADVNVDLARLYRVQEVEQQIRQVPGIEQVEAWASAQAEALHPDGSSMGNVGLLAPPANSQLVEPMLLEGRWLLPGDQKAIAVNQAFWAEVPGLRPGDTLRLKIAGREEHWTVVGIFQFAGADEMLGFANYEPLSQVLHQAGRAALYRVTLADASLASQEEASVRIDDQLRNLGYRVGKVEAGDAMAHTISETLWILIFFLLIMALLTAVVGSIGLAGTLSMNILERTREIGVMRAIGAHDRIVMKLVVTEGLLISLISFVLSAALSFPISAMLSDIISQAIFKTSTGVAFTVQGFAIWLVVVVTLSTLASVAPARRACQVTIREVLAYE